MEPGRLVARRGAGLLRCHSRPCVRSARAQRAACPLRADAWRDPRAPTAIVNKDDYLDAEDAGSGETGPPARVLFGSHFGTYEIVSAGSGPGRLVPFSVDGAPSPLGAGFADIAAHPMRIRRPCVRRSYLRGEGNAATGLRGAEPFVEVGWDTALDLVERGLRRVIERHGNRAIFAGSYGWASAGRFHHAQSQLKRFLNLQGGFVNSVNTYSYGAAGVLLPHVLGRAYAGACDAASSWDRIAGHTEVLLVFGGLRPSNAQVEAGGCGRHRVREWLQRALDRGTRLIVVSPTRSDVPAGMPARHVPIRPGTDAAVLLAIAHAVLANGREDRRFLERCTVGWERWREHVLGRDDGMAKTPAWAEAISGVPAATIRELADQVVGKRSYISVSWSLQRAEFGEQPYWAAIALACLAGQIGQPGGGFGFGLGSVNSVGQPIARLRGPALPQGHNPVADFIPVARFADMLLGPGQGFDYDGRRAVFPDIRFVYWCGGNPFHHHQDINRLRRAIRKPDTFVVHESVWTATARHADIVLPVALPSEREDLAASTRDNWIVYSRPLAAPPPGTRTDHRIFVELSRRFGCEHAFTEGRDEAAWIEHLYRGFRERHPELPAYDAFRRTGYASLDGFADAPAPFDLLSGFVADPVASPLETPSGRIEISSAVIQGFGYDDCPGFPTWRAPREWLGAELASRYPIQLLTPQPACRLHGQLDAAPASVESKVAGREPLRMHPADAAARGIRPGDVVRLSNGRGACLAGAVLDDSLLPGVAVLATGATYDPDDPAAERPLDRHGNPNVLTADVGTSKLSQGPAVNCLVEIERWGDAPPVMAFSPPSIDREAAGPGSE
jgi:biotin/methionine sulfoxide reductase